MSEQHPAVLIEASRVGERVVVRVKREWLSMEGGNEDKVGHEYEATCVDEELH